MNYTSRNAFNLALANRTIDRIYFHIDEHYKTIPLTIDLNAKLVLSGKAAAILQGATVVPVNQIVFVTDDTLLSTVIRDVIPNQVANKGVIKFKDRTVFFFDGFILEFWKLNTTITVAVADGIYSQLISEIPLELL